MKEVWKTIIDFEDYQISSYGRVNSMKHFNCKILKQSKNHGGYYHVNLYKNKVMKSIDNHRLVALHFIPNPYHKPQVNHKDGNKLNNHIENLEWCTCSENHKHAFKHNLKSNIGIKNSNSKLTENEVLTIHGLYIGGLKQKEIALLFNLTKDNISKIILGHSWKCLFQ